jgi:hypothetical protein
MRLHDRFGGDQEVKSGLLKATQQMRKITNANQYAGFLHSAVSQSFIPPKRLQGRIPSGYQKQRAAYLQYGRIGASSAAKQRRVAGSSRGNMRLPAGGGKKKRSNYISTNIRNNVPNRKLH